METNILNSGSKKIFNYMTSNATAVCGIINIQDDFGQLTYFLIY